MLLGNVTGPCTFRSIRGTLQMSVNSFEMWLCFMHVLQAWLHG